MIKVMFGHDEAVAKWVSDRIPHMPTGFEKMKTIAALEDGNILGAVVFHEYRGNDIQMSCASVSPRWLTRPVLETFFAYPFRQLGCDRVTAFVPSRNSHTRQFIERIGFVYEGNMRRGFIDDDCIIYGMVHDECKWINHGKKLTLRTSRA